MKKILIIGAGAPANPSLMRKLEIWANAIICADAGADTARRLDMYPVAVIGDFDSISKETLNYYNKREEISLINILEQETTDMEKAIVFTMGSGKIEDIIIAGAGGSRSDHFLHTVGLMYKYRNKTSIRIIDTESIISLKQSSFRESCRVGERISLIPYGGDVTNVGTIGLKFPIQGQNLSPGEFESISNQAASESISVNFDSGNLLFYRNAETVISNEIRG